MMLDGRPGASRLRIIDSGERMNYKPCVDVTFGSAAKVYQDKVLSMVLTGMGADGRDGARMLKNSGSVRITSTGGEIAYNAPYAAAVEFGVESDVPFRGDQWIEIPMHRRRNGSIVKRHWRKYTDKRAFGFTPAGGAGDIVRVFTQNLKKIGQRFLGRAFEEKLTDLTESCEDEFRRIDGKTYKV